MIEDKIKKINSLLAQENNIALDMLGSTIEALEKKDEKLLEKVMTDDEDAINALEIYTTKLCVRTLALYQPEAKFLRHVVSALQINHALERVADVTVSVAKRMLHILSKNDIPEQTDILKIIQLSIAMINDGVEAFINADTDSAKSIFARDDEVDDLRDTIINNTILSMKQGDIEIEEAISVIRIAQDIERIADMSTTIAKNVVYMTLGEVIEH